MCHILVLVGRGDVLLHAGDLSSWGYPHQVRQVCDWIKAQAHPVKIIVAGNHDLCLDPAVLLEDETPESLETIREYVRSDEMKDAGVRYLEHEATRFTTPSGRTWKAYGSPAAPRYARGAFQYHGAEAAQEIYGNVPLDTEILLTHTPPYGTLDMTGKGKKAGCRYLGARLAELPLCKLHIFGHIHEAFGLEILDTGRVAVNAAVVRPGSGPVIVDIRE